MDEKKKPGLIARLIRSGIQYYSDDPLNLVALMVSVIALAVAIGK